ncbi:SNF2-related protein [Peptoniphilus equinus]|uniref:SNF2-related protein n=2 Tax=Peptoniphilus equinus TaxID=3016343 RepID=A0ABY7QT32_9FIRM|nr:SNF2-related protein [Peptoniphilus equinus]WBW49313.1 SNF2-related protein [Peptoniphilus equinus]
MPSKNYEALLKTIKSQFKAFKDRDVYAEFLRNASYHYNYGLYNQIAILQGMGTAKAVAAYDFWGKNGRYVRRNNHGIAILNPKKGSIQKVFDISQTGVLSKAEHPIGIWHSDDTDLERLFQNAGFKARISNIMNDMYQSNNPYRDIVQASVLYQVAYRLGMHDFESYESGEFDQLKNLSPSEIQAILRDVNMITRGTLTVLRHELGGIEYENHGRREVREGTVLREVRGGRNLSADGAKTDRESSGALRHDETTLSTERRRSESSPTASGTFGSRRSESLSSERARAMQDSDRQTGRRMQSEGDHVGESGVLGMSPAEDANAQHHGRNGASRLRLQQLRAYQQQLEQQFTMGSHKKEVTEQVAMTSFFNADEVAPEMLLLDKDLDHDGVIDRYDADLKDSNVQTIGQLDERDKEQTDVTRSITIKERIENNLSAIALVQTLDKDNRVATPEEKTILQGFTGWGGLTQFFDGRESTKAYREKLQEMVTIEEYKDAQSSMLTGYYTPDYIAKNMCNALEILGFKSGKILDPSIGVGAFEANMPDAMLDNSEIVAYELDGISAKISAYLYDNAKIKHSGFEDTTLEDNAVDIAITNVPFGNYTVFDPVYAKQNYLIHDYFIHKSLDKVRSGGIVAVITTAGTMDKKDSRVRKDIADKAKLIGAFRLPDNAFIGAQVTSDILFFQKYQEGEVRVSEDWLELETRDGITMNQYFHHHPEHVLGNMQYVSGRYGDTLTCKATGNLSDQLQKAIRHLPENIYVPRSLERVSEVLNSEPEVVDVNELPNFSYFLTRDGVKFKGNGDIQDVTGDEDRIKRLIAIRDIARRLYKAEIDDESDNIVHGLMAQLNTAYDEFVEIYGHIHDKRNLQAFESDNSIYFLRSMENVDDKGKFQSKADVFKERVIKPLKAPEIAENAQDALAISVNYKGKIDFDFMEKLSGISREELINSLEGVEIFYNDLTQSFETRDEFLTGDVREKCQNLRLKLYGADKLADQRIAKNIKALKAVYPPWIHAADINVKLGANWIPHQVIEDFIRERLHFVRDVSYSDVTGQWYIDEKGPASFYMIANTEYGTKRMNALHILEKTLNQNEQITINDSITNPDGSTSNVVNKKETIIVQEKQERLKQEFKDWIFEDMQRRQELEKIYNERFNGVVERHYDGSQLDFPGMNLALSLKPHQKDVVARAIYGGNSLIAHVVGAGKTYAAIASVMESKRLGLCNKAMVVVPNHLTEQWGSDFMTLYPNAKILVATSKDFTAERRKDFFGKVANGNYDAVIIGHSQFSRIPLSKDYEMKFVQDEINKLEDKKESLSYFERKGFGYRQIMQQEKKLKSRLSKILYEQKQHKDLGIVNFDELGVDKLVIDEAHEFKNLQIATSLTGVSGISTSASQKAFDLYMKTKWMNEVTNNRGTIFLTGTPVSNSMAELYIMQKYLQEDTLKSKGLVNFDTWVSVFGEITKSMELRPEGEGYQMKTKFSKFGNLPELIGMFKEFADVKNREDLDLPVPTLHNEVIKTEPSEIQKEIVHNFADRAYAVRNGIDRRVDNFLLITNDGKKCALDQRLMDFDLPDDPNSKVNACVNKTLEIYNKTQSEKLTQLIFCDLSTPGGKDASTFNLYDDIKTKLMAGGIKEKDIAFIHDANTESKKEALFEKVRQGEVRVLLGSTRMMGTGTNVQEKLIAIHNLDCPWRPSDRDQRIGRIQRQGNQNPDVYEYTYITKGTFDAYLYQMLENKQRFISQVMKSDNQIRNMEDVDNTVLNYAEIKALAIDNPLIKDKMELENEVSRLQIERSMHIQNRFSMDRIVRDHPVIIDRQLQTIDNINADMNTVQENTNEDFEMVIDGVKYSKVTEAGQALMDSYSKRGESKEPIGSYRGIGIRLTYNPTEKAFQAVLKGKETYIVELGTSPRANVSKIDHFLNNLDARMTGAIQRIDQLNNELVFAKDKIDAPFFKEEEYQNKLKKLNEINIRLKLGEDMIPREELIDRAKTLIIEKNINGTVNFEDLSAIEVYNRSNASNKLSIEVNLDDPAVVTKLNGEIIATENYQSINELIEFKLQDINVNDYIQTLQAEGKLKKNVLLDAILNDDAPGISRGHHDDLEV